MSLELFTGIILGIFGVGGFFLLRAIWRDYFGLAARRAKFRQMLDFYFYKISGKWAKTLVDGVEFDRKKLYRLESKMFDLESQMSNVRSRLPLTLSEQVLARSSFDAINKKRLTKKRVVRNTKKRVG